MFRYFISHSTHYKYTKPVQESTNRICLYPYNDIQQQLVSHKIFVTGNPNIYSYIDEFNNRVGFFNYVAPHDSMVINSQAEIIVKKINPPNEELVDKNEWTILDITSQNIDYMHFLNVENFFAKNKFKKILNELKDDGDSVLNFSKKLCEYVNHNFNYEKGVTNIFSTLDEVWKLKSGVCQDFTNILIQLCRLSKIPSRYVSGYVYPKGGLLGSGATHAWVEVYLPNYGWLGLDPTNNCIADECHIRLSVGRNYDDCSPVKGVYKGNEKQTMKVDVYVDNKKIKKKNEIIFDDLESNNSSLNIEPFNSYQKKMQIVQQQQQ